MYVSCICPLRATVHVTIRLTLCYDATLLPHKFVGFKLTPTEVLHNIMYHKRSKYLLALVP